MMFLWSLHLCWIFLVGIEGLKHRKMFLID